MERGTSFSRIIIEWYQQHKRDLPWRKTRDPYIIWLSEIIMQQTRVEQGLPYFERFAAKYPNVHLMAAADQGQILKDWEGLGYYSRGRNMHHTARMVMEDHVGYFPSSYDKLIGLKGIGEYTAAAISSFSKDEARAVVDGNVFRLLARFFGNATPINSSGGKKFFTELANTLLDRSQPGTFNQAAMEFGSLQCRPRNPLCHSCPLQSECATYSTGTVNELPVKLKQKKARERYFSYFVMKNGNKILISQRGPGDIWENLFELPLFETAANISVPELLRSAEFQARFGTNVRLKHSFIPVRHILSHQKLHICFHEIENFSEQTAEKNGWNYIDFEELGGLAQPKPIFEFFKNLLKLI